MCGSQGKERETISSVGCCLHLWQVSNFQKSRVGGYGSLTELPEVPGIVVQACRTYTEVQDGYKKVLYPRA